MCVRTWKHGGRTHISPSNTQTHTAAVGIKKTTAKKHTEICQGPCAFHLLISKCSIKSSTDQNQLRLELKSGRAALAQLVVMTNRLLLCVCVCEGYLVSYRQQQLLERCDVIGVRHSRLRSEKHRTGSYATGQGSEGGGFFSLKDHAGF